jgi:hypothetical protein
MYIAQLTNLDSPEYAFYDLLAEISPLDTAPPCLLAEGMADRCEMDADWLAEVEAMESE